MSGSSKGVREERQRSKRGRAGEGGGVSEKEHTEKRVRQKAVETNHYVVAHSACV